MAEAAGFVLSAIPLVLGLLQQCEECFRTLGCMRHFKQEYRKCRNRLSTIELEFDHILDILLCEVYADGEGLEDFKYRASKNGWSLVESRLNERLPLVLQKLYLDTMKGLKEALEELGSELGLKKSAFQTLINADDAQADVVSGTPVNEQKRWLIKVTSLVRESRTRLSYETQRMKFSLGKRKRDDILTQIDRYMSSLLRIAIWDMNMGPLRRVQRRAAPVQQGLLGFWRHAHAVHCLLALSWTCSCKGLHDAELRLLHRDIAQPRFEICFRSMAPSEWSSHRAIITKATIDTSLHPTSGLTQQASRHNSVATNRKVNQSKTRPAGIKKIWRRKNWKVSKMAAENTNHASQMAEKALRMSKAASEQSAQQPPTAIVDLCESIKKHDESHPCSGLLAHDSIGETYKLSSPSTNQRNDRKISLKAILETPETTPGRTQRYKMALTIASSHLQLHSSGWLDYRWDSDEIFFDAVDGSPLLNLPRLRSPNYPMPHDGLPDETFPTLGIILLELCFGQLLRDSGYRRIYESTANYQDLIARWAAATKWAESVEGEAGPEYADAVNWCLAPRRPVQADDVSWRQSLQRNVIEPLRRTYEKLTSTHV